MMEDAARARSEALISLTERSLIALTAEEKALEYKP